MTYTSAAAPWVAEDRARARPAGAPRLSRTHLTISPEPRRRRARCGWRATAAPAPPLVDVVRVLPRVAVLSVWPTSAQPSPAERLAAHSRGTAPCEARRRCTVGCSGLFGGITGLGSHSAERQKHSAAEQ
jgi:hypothetical protein